jgi:hypothetical protein
LSRNFRPGFSSYGIRRQSGHKENAIGSARVQRNIVNLISTLANPRKEKNLERTQ